MEMLIFNQKLLYDRILEAYDSGGTEILENLSRQLTIYHQHNGRFLTLETFNRIRLFQDLIAAAVERLQKRNT